MFRTLMAAMLLISSISLANAEGAYVKLYGGISDPSYSEGYAAANSIQAGNVTAGGTSTFFGGAFGYYITDNFSVEVAVEQLELEFGSTGGIVSSGQISTTAGFINAYYHFNDNFYAGVGIGGGDANLDDFTITALNDADLTSPRALNDNERNSLSNLIDIELPYQAIFGFKLPLTDSIYWDNNIRHLVISDAKLTTVSTGLRFEF